MLKRRQFGLQNHKRDMVLTTKQYKKLHGGRSRRSVLENLDKEIVRFYSCLVNVYSTIHSVMGGATSGA